MKYNKNLQVDNSGRQVPFFIQDYKYIDIQSSAFDPCTNEASDEEKRKYMDYGFLVRPNIDGSFYGITWQQYYNNNFSLEGITPEPYLGCANQWIECPIVYVYAHNDASFGNVSTFINVGIIGYTTEYK